MGEEMMQEKKDMAKKAGVPENFFDSAKTKAFLNLNKAPQKSILKNSSKSEQDKDPPKQTSSANVKATGKEWTSRAPALTVQPGPKKPKKDKSPNSQKSLLRTPSGGAMAHLEEEMPADFFDKKENKEEEVEEKEGDLPAGFF